MSANERLGIVFAWPMMLVIYFMALFFFQRGSPLFTPKVFFGLGAVVITSFVLAMKYFLDFMSGRLLIEKRRADVIAASILDGILLLKGDQVVYANPIGGRIIGITSEKHLKGVRISLEKKEARRSGRMAVAEAILRSIPVEFSLDLEERKYYYLIQSLPISYGVLEKANHWVGDLSKSITDFQADTLILAQDVTLVRESQEAKSHFLATLSHEIKTPVTSLTMATRLLRKFSDEFSNPVHRELISTCVADVDRLRGLLEDLLSVSQLDSFIQKLEVQNVNIGKLLRHSVQSFQKQAEERGIRLSFENLISGPSVAVEVDAAKVSWALSNLLTNALRHTPRGGKVDTTLSLEGGYVEIRVKDTGPGIDRKRQERIFEKFNSHYDLRVARTGAAGIGLAIAREIVVAHGGNISVLSQLGHGAEFCFTLPLKKHRMNISANTSSNFSVSASMKGHQSEKSWIS